MFMHRREFLKKLLVGLGATFILPRIVRAVPEIQEGESVVNPHYVTHGNGFGNRIAITLDDGPSPGVTETILKELEKHDLRATFFMIGQKVKAHPELARAVADAGHEIGNHSYTHPFLTRFSNDKVDDELQKTQEVIYNATGKTPLWFRPPYGAFDKPRMGNIPLSKGLGVAYWSVDPMDWKRPGADAIVSRVLSETNPGSIVLMHDLHPQTAQAVPSLFEGIKERAFSSANMTRFLGQPYA